jgi:septal ring factor EnvC (AmiA/AmiB activator)
MIGSTLSNTSQDMREQADRSAQAITDRVAETEEATRKLETNLKKTVDEIAEVETTIRRLKDAIWEKDAPNKVQYDTDGHSPRFVCDFCCVLVCCP